MYRFHKKDLEENGAFNHNGRLTSFIYKHNSVERHAKLRKTQRYHQVALQTMLEFFLKTDEYNFTLNG
jgi:hypothetical protein